MKSIQELCYASLSSEQETKLQEYEKHFNEKFGTSLYFMVMDSSKHNSSL